MFPLDIGGNVRIIITNMGTRNLTCVVLNGEYRIAKYGQWDGYREGLGTAILEFLRTEFNREQFITGLSKVCIAGEALIQKFWAEAGATSNMVSMDVSEKFKRAHPELSRDPSGADILRLIQAGKCEWSKPEVNFAADSLFCEWAYVIDLDKNTFEIYEGFNKAPLPAGERFEFLPKDQDGDKPSEYYPVRLLKSYSLRRLPTAKTMCKATTWYDKAEKAKATLKKMRATVTV